MAGTSALPVLADSETGTHARWQGVPKVLGPKWLQMPILTVGMLGLQIIWSVEMSYASPYLLSLGLSKSLTSIVFLAGPLSGLIVQPLIGVLSDGSHSRFGRRRPYIFFGLLISFGAMYLFGFTRQFASLITVKGSSANDSLTMGLAIFSIYCLDFSINAVQAMDRALLVDILPVSEQERGNAWAGRMFGLGSVIGFFVGNVDLTLSLPFFGGTQLELLCGVTSTLLLITHFIMIFNVKERILQRPTDGSRTNSGPWTAVKNIWDNFLALPGIIKQICLIQLFAWIGWFPVLFWTSLYVGGLHKRNSAVPETDVARAALEAEATRLGSRALLCNALASLIASIICPFFVSNGSETTKDSRENFESEHSSSWVIYLRARWRQRRTCHLAILWAMSHGVFSACMLSTFLIKDVSAATAIMTISGFSWAITQWAPFALIAEAIYRASFLNSSQYILADAHDENDEEDMSIPLRETHIDCSPEEQQFGNVDERRRLISEIKEEDHIEDASGVPSKHVHFEAMESDSRSSKEIDATPSVASLGLNAAAQQSQGTLHVASTDGQGVEYPGALGSANSGSIEDKAGIILGIHNVFVVIPQFIITGLSSILFAVMDPDKSVLASHGAPAHPGNPPNIPIGNLTLGRNVLAVPRIRLPRAEGEAGTRSADSVAVIFRIGGVSAAIACILALRLAKELKRISR